MKLRWVILILLLTGMCLGAVLAVANSSSVAGYAQRYAPPFAIALFYLFVCLIVIALRLRRGRVIVYNCAFVFLALGIAELYFRVAPTLRDKDYEVVLTDSSGKTVPFYHAGDPDLGYANQPNIVVSANKRARDGSILYDVKYSIDARGLRKTLPTNNNGVVFFGDSFVFGEGLNDEETMPQIYSSLSGQCALNFGVSGYGAHHMLRELEIGRLEALGVTRPQAIVYTILPHFHISRAAGLAPWDQKGPRYELIDGEAKYVGSFDETRSLLDRTMSNSAVDAAVLKKYPAAPDSEADRQRFLAIILKARKIAQEKYHAPFLLLLWNAFLQENVRSNAEWLAQRLKENQLATLELSTVPGLENADSYIPVDFHPNGNGNTLLAHAVISFLAPYLRESSNAKLCSQEAH
jgi:hypothetical protein